MRVRERESAKVRMTEVSERRFQNQNELWTGQKIVGSVSNRKKFGLWFFRCRRCHHHRRRRRRCHRRRRCFSVCSHTHTSHFSFPLPIIIIKLDLSFWKSGRRRIIKMRTCVCFLSLVCFTLFEGFRQNDHFP